MIRVSLIFLLLSACAAPGPREDFRVCRHVEGAGTAVARHCAPSRTAVVEIRGEGVWHGQ
jgi:hypothetical protein